MESVRKSSWFSNPVRSCRRYPLKKHLPCYTSVRFSLLGNTHLDLALDYSLGLAHLLPIHYTLDPVGLEQFDQTPSMVCIRSTGTWRLVTNRARHLDILLWGACNFRWHSLIRFEKYSEKVVCLPGIGPGFQEPQSCVLPLY